MAGGIDDGVGGGVDSSLAGGVEGGVDGDGIGDNPNSGTSDGCPNVVGDSFWDRLGCPDSDGDGWSDPTEDWGPNGECTGADAFKDDPTQWCDSDGDGYGDNESGNQPDACPNQAGTSDGDVFTKGR